MRTPRWHRVTDEPSVEERLAPGQLAELSSEMRVAVLRLRSGPAFLGPDPPAVPRGTAAALRRRGLVDNPNGGSRIVLTALGRAVADLAFRRQLRLFPPGDGEIRMTVIVYAEQGEVFAADFQMSNLGEVATFRKDRGTFEGRLIDYEVIQDGAALRLTLDVPGPFEYLATTRVSLADSP